MRNKAFSAIGVVITLIVIIGGGIFAWQYFGAPEVPEEEGEIQIGTIEGSLGYPSEGIPQDMSVCAENIITKKQYCTTTHIQADKYTYGTGYKIGVPAGAYYVFAALLSWKDYRAYYSEFVVCGIKVGCSSHDPIKITVEAGKVIENIDPQDWYK